MLEVFVNFICAFMLAVIGFNIINLLIEDKQQLTKKNILFLLLNGILTAFIHFLNENNTLLSFIINIITYKKIFNISFGKSTLLTGIISLFILLADTINLVFQVSIIPLYKYQDNAFIYLLSNIIVAFISIGLLKIKIPLTYLKKGYNTLSKNDIHLNVIFILLVLIVVSRITFSLYVNYNLDHKVFADIVILFCILAIGIIFINNKDTYNKLSKEYDLLLQNVQTFEEWIEREQFTRHEYKNQLAVIYALSSEKEVKNKIEEIINQTLNIKNEVVNNLKDIPRGGFKGLLYYKTIIAEKEKIKVTVDVSIKQKGILQKLSKEKINTLAKVIGIYYDNAIEAAKESRKKILLLEIYELKDKINIVFSNTFNKNSIIAKHNEKGVSSKGKGHGYGLYFAKKIISDNKWIEEKQEIIDNYYIETITIKKSTSK